MGSHYDEEREVDSIAAIGCGLTSKRGFINTPKPLVQPRQVGGSHYKSAIQPVEYIQANNLNFLEGNVIKYVTRHRRKNGIEDLRKARDYLDRLIQEEM